MSGNFAARRTVSRGMAARGLALLTLALAAGCSNDESGANSGSAGQGGSGGAAGQAGSGGAAGAGEDGGKQPCSMDPATFPQGSTCVLEARGRVIDGSGAPRPKLRTSVCGPVCYFGETGDDGRFVVTMGDYIPPSEYSALPHGRPHLTSFYYALPAAAQGSVDLGDLLVLSLPTSGPALIVKQDGAGAPAQTVTSGDVTLEVAEGVAVRIDVEDVILDAEGRMFRSLSIPAQHRDTFADPALGIVLLYALTPFEATFQDAATAALSSARLSFANSANFAPNAAIEVLALGSYLYADWVKPGSFEPVATAKVSADGTRIDLDVGAGLPYLTWVGLRPKP